MRERAWAPLAVRGESPTWRMRWDFHHGLLGCALVVLLASGAAAEEATLIERATAIHARVLTIDTHDDIPLTFGHGRG